MHSVLYGTRSSSIFGLIILKDKEYNDIGVILENRADKDILYNNSRVKRVILGPIHRL